MGGDEIDFTVVVAPSLTPDSYNLTSRNFPPGVAGREIFLKFSKLEQQHLLGFDVFFLKKR